MAACRVLRCRIPAAASRQWRWRRTGACGSPQSSGNRIGRINADGTGLAEFALPRPDSGPRIIALGADGNMWFSEHTGNRMGRITPAGVITEFEIPTPASQPRAIALGADGNIWFGGFASGKVGRITPAGAITEFALPNAGQRTTGTGRGTGRVTSGYRNIVPAGLRASRRKAKSPSSPCHGPTRDRVTSPPAPMARCGSWSCRATWTVCRQTARAWGGSPWMAR